jgi:hypothetical protein
MSIILRTVLTVILGVAMVVVAPVPALGTLGDLACTASAQANFTPPPSGGGAVDVDITGSLANCASLDGQWSNLRSGVITGTGQATAQSGVPCSLLLTITGTATITWSPPGSPDSQIDIRFNTNPLAGTVTITVTVTEGPLTGDALVPIIVQVSPNLDCAITGLTTLSTALAVAAFS